eukprot:CAMPEP_0194286860 /NCGR_PEP_ID=MMETSP0169-20130528/33464_1 /TAXON_ID=218684 /ORGANISM="Corethron pennatum, Strain L29A3" /LENGTH=189 /DNA_ID=CAMNT_0039033389 /DNA_START=55 /DNA_END=624 /DNA_ORIENTATION=+
MVLSRCLHVLFFSLALASCSGYSPYLPSSDPAVTTRRKAISRALNFAGLATAASTISAAPSFAAPTIYNTPKGVKYAITRPSNGKIPIGGDLVVVEYTGYLSNGQIFDATHAEGKKNELMFKLGSGQVIPGLDEAVAQMQVGQKIQAIIPPSLAYGEKGVCLEDGECLIKPDSTLVYDINLFKTSIPPP